MNTLQQQFASSVYKRVQAYAEESNEKDSKKYGAMALRLPILVRKSGLVQAIAFLEMKAGGDSGKPFQVLLNDLSGVVMAGKSDSLSAASRTENLQEYIYLTRRTLIALDWFRRFAQSILNVETTDSVEGE